MHTIDDLRDELFDTLRALRDKTAPMDVARARAVVEVASVLVDTAKVEVAMLEATGTGDTGFIPNREGKPRRDGELPPGTPQRALRAAGGR